MGVFIGAIILVKLGRGQRSFMTDSGSFSGKKGPNSRAETRDCIDGAIDLTADHVSLEKRKRESGAVFE